MFKWIKNYFTLPVFEDDELTRRTRLLISILVPFALMTTVVVGAMVALYGMPRRFADMGPVIAAALIVVATLGAFRLVRRRFPTGLAIAILLLMWGVVTSWIWSEEGLSGGHTSYTYALVIVLAALLLGPRSVTVFTLLSFIGVVGAFYAESQGSIPGGGAGVDLVDLMIVSTIVVLIGVFLRYAVKSMQEAIDRARRSAQAQAAANSELEMIRRSLEERVAVRTQALQSRSALLLTANDLGRAAASLRDLEDLLSHMPQMISEQTGFYHVGLFLMDEFREFAVLRGASSPEGQEMMVQNYRVAVSGADLVGMVTAKRELRVASDAGPNAVSFADSPFPRTKSQLALPLIAGNRLVGALDLHSTEHDILTDQMIEVMRLLADQIAIAIESAQLFAQSQEALAAELRAYGTVSREAWQDMVRAESTAEGGLRFLSDAPGVIRLASGEKPAVMQQARQTGRIVKEANSTLAIPIQIREGVSIGALRLNKPAWGEDEIALVETLTEQLGAALESARLYQETQRREARERITREITEDIRRSVEMEVILKAAVRNLGEALGVPRTYVRLMLSEGALSEDSPVGELPAEDLPGEDLDESSLDESPSDESPPEDIETPSEVLVDDVSDSAEVSPSPDTPAASAAVVDEGVEHDEP